MKRSYVFSMLVLLFLSCATQVPKTPIDFNIPKFEVDHYVPKINNFIILLDTSQSMSENYNGYMKFELAKNFINQLNKTIPDLNYTAGLRTIGHHSDISSDLTKLFYDISNYNKKNFENALNSISKPGGTTPLEKGINKLSDDLKNLKGKTAIIITSDAKSLNDSPATALKELVKQNENRVCIYTVQQGGNQNGKEVLEELANTGKCGFYIHNDDLLTTKGMADFVTKIFVTKAPDSDKDGVYDKSDKCPNTNFGFKVDPQGCPFDSDKDGVVDELDKCPDTPQGIAVDNKGCPLDTDGDGVFDTYDKCPDTASGTPVNEKGCTLDSDNDGVFDNEDQCNNTPAGAKVNSVGCWIIENLNFDSSKWNIKEEFHSSLDHAVDIIKNNPDLKIEVQGHTDSSGGADYNMELSILRAREVMKYFVNQGLSDQNINAVGYGHTKPVATNETPEGRAQNRRVQLMILE